MKIKGVAREQRQESKKKHQPIHGRDLLRDSDRPSMGTARKRRKAKK